MERTLTEMRRALAISLCLLLFPLVMEAADLGFGACLTCPSNTPPPTAAGDLLLGNSTPIWILKAAGVEGACFRITSGLPEWTVCPTGLAGAAANGAVYATGPTTATSTSALANGQILVGRTGLSPVAAAIQGTPLQIAVTPGVGTITVSIPPSPTLPGTTAGTFSGSLAGNASTASAFDHNPAPCGANLFATDQDAAGTLGCTQPAFSNITGTATTGQLPATAVTSIVNDTNVIGTINTQVLTLGWTGALAKTRIVASAVYNDQVNTFTGAGVLTGLPAPASPSDAATKGYVDTVAAGMSVKTSPRVATTAALTAAYFNNTTGVGATLTNNGTLAALSIDGVALASTDRVLVKNQASTLQNGLYTVTTVGSGAVAWVLTRATDYDATGEITGGSYVVITTGTTNSGTTWIMTEPGPITVGTTPIVFTVQAVAPQTVTLTGAVSGTGTGTIATTLALVASSLGGTGANNIATTGRYLKGDGTNFVTSIGSASGVGPCTNQFVRVLNSDAPPTCATVSLATDVTGTLLAANHPALVGDVTVGVGTVTTVLANIPTATPMVGSLLATPITAPGIPAPNKASIYVDSTSKNIAVKDDAGVVKHGVRTNTGASDNFLTAITDDGVVSRAQPSFANISSTLLATQMVALAGDVNNLVGTVNTTIQPGVVTLAKMADLATARLLGRTAAGTGPPEALSVVPAAVFPALTGDVSTPGGTLSTTLVKVPTGTPHEGTALFTMITAPATPAAGKAFVYVDSTSKNMAVKDDSGIIKHGVQTITCPGTFISAINDAGLPTCATPAGGGNVSNTGTPANGQLAIWFSPTVIQGITALPAANFPHVVGDVDIPAGNLTATLSTVNSNVGSFTNATITVNAKGLVTAVASGTSGGLTTIDGQTGPTIAITRGAGVGGSSSGNTLTFSTNSTEADFLAAGALTCGAATQGKMQVHTTPLQYCDNAATPALQYAAYGTNTGLATAGDSATAFFPTGQLEAARGGTGVDTSGATGVPKVAAGIWSIATPTGTGAPVLDTSPVLGTPFIANFSNATHLHTTAAGGGTLTEAALILTDLTTNNATVTAHGFLKKLSNVATEFMNGQGNWAVPGGGGTVTATGGPLTLNALVLGAGGTDTKALVSLGTTTTVLHGNAAGVPSFGPVTLTSDVAGILPAANLPVTTVNNIVSDTNVIGSISAQVLTITWASTLAKSRLLGTVVYTDQANTWTTGAQDLGAATSFKIPVAANATTVTNGLLAYDLTNHMLHAAQTSADAKIPQFTITPANDDCVKWVVSGTNIKLGSAGAACGAAVGGTVTATGGPLTLNALVLGAGGTDTKALVSLGTTTTVLHGNAAGVPTFAAVTLTTDVAGILPNTNTTATSANTASAIVTRDGSGNFVAGTITANLTGTASLAATGDSATAFFTTGQLEAARGGTGLDSSAASGIAKVTSGTWSVSAVNLASTEVTGDLPFTSMVQIATDRLLGRDTAATGDIEQLTVGGGIEFTGTGGIQRSALLGDVTVAVGSPTTVLANIPAGVPVAGALAWADGVRQIFNPNATVAGINVGAQAGNPSTLVNGDLWYDSTAGQLKAQVAGAPVALGASSGTPGGSSGQVQFNNTTFGGSSGFTLDTTSVLTEKTHCTTITNADVTLGVHRCVYMVTGNANRVVTLPAAGDNVNARVYEVYKTDAGTGTVTLHPSTTNTLNGVPADVSVTNRYEGWRIIEVEATGWIVGTGIIGPLSVAQGGTGATTFTGGLLQANGTAPVTSIVNSVTLGQVLRVTGSNAYGWGAIDLADTDAVTGVLPTANTATKFRTRTCMIVVGSDNGVALVDADLGPQLHQCTIDVPMTVQEIRISSDAGTPSAVVQKRTIAGSATALISSALATAASGAVSCAKTSAAGTASYDGTTTCATTLQNNTAMPAGTTLGLTSGTASTAKRVSIVVTMTID
jgi:hypothetical protein